MSHFGDMRSPSCGGLQWRYISILY